MRVFLTGASGMVGQNLLRHPGAAEHEWLAPTHGELDLTRADAVAAFIASRAPDVVVHAAGRVGGIQANIAAPTAFLLENLDMGRSVLMGAAAAGVPRLLNLGSSCMYPADRSGALVEEEVLGGKLEPTNEGYALAKIAVARLGSYLSRERGLSYKTVIPCNLYGPHDTFDPARSHLISAAIVKLHEAREHGRAQVEIWGTGEARREFMYVGDLAELILKALRDFDTMPELMNAGTGEDLSVNEYYTLAAEAVGYAGRFVHDLSRPVGMARKLTDVQKAARWGWRSRTPLHEGLARTYQYYLENGRR